MAETELDPMLTNTLIRCKQCQQLLSGNELKQNDGKCPSCGMQLAKPPEDK